MLRLALLVAVGALVGCTYEPKLESAMVKRRDDKVSLVMVPIAKSVAQKIKNDQIYAKIIVDDCRNIGSERYPLETNIGDAVDGSFTFKVDSPIIYLSGVGLNRIIDEYKEPCVYLQGGSYFHGRIRSSVVPLKRL